LVVVEAAFLRLGFNALTACKVLGIGCGFVLVASTVRLTQLGSQSIWVQFGAGLLAVLQPAVAVGCVNGLETMPFAACVTYALLRVLTATTVRDSVIVGA